MQNIFVTVELLYGTWGKRERRMGGKGVRKSNERLE
jgi:hypothetical protein